MQMGPDLALRKVRVRSAVFGVRDAKSWSLRVRVGAAGTVFSKSLVDRISHSSSLRIFMGTAAHDYGFGSLVIDFCGFIVGQNTIARRFGEIHA